MRVSILLLLVSLAACLASSARAQSKTSFLPSRDMWTVNQPANKQGQYSLGVCNGMLQSSLAYWEVIRKDQGDDAPEDRSLSKVSSRMEQEYGKQFTEQTVERLHSITRNNANTLAGGTTQPQTADSVVEMLDSKDATPVTINLSDGKRDHLVAAYDYKRDGDKIIFKVADPNFPSGDPQADNRTLVYDLGTRTFEPYKNVDGSQFSEVAQVRNPATKALKEDLTLQMGDAEVLGKLPDPSKHLSIPSPFDRHEVPPPVAVTADPEVGGVLISFDPTIYDGLLSEEELAALVNQVHAFAKSGQSGTLCIQARPRQEELQVVSLTRVLAANAETLGKLTRVRGYVLGENGELFVVGVAEAGRPRVSLDTFTVALRSFYLAHNKPFISLDPEPYNFAAPHKARIGGIDAELEDTEFVETMLSADYLMKRIGLGEEEPRVDGFKTWYTIVEEAGPHAHPTASRMWLAPLASPVPDVYEYGDSSSHAVLFDCRVQVQTEQVKLAAEGLAGTGTIDELEQRAADLMTDFYGPLELKYDEFYRLHQVFELCKLSSLLRARGVECVSLQAISARTPTRVLIKRSYVGIGPKLVAGTALSVSGGCQTRARSRSKAAVWTDQVAPLLTAVRDGESRALVTLPASVNIPTSGLAAFNAELHFNAGVSLFTEGDYSAALARLNLALKLDDEFAEAYGFRAVTLLSLGRIEEANSDADRAASEDNRMLGFRAVMRAYQNERSGALSDAEEAARLCPRDTTVLLWCAMAEFFSLDFQRAEDTVAAILRLAPLDVQTLNLKTVLDRVWQMGATKGCAFADSIRRIPPPINEAMVGGSIALSAMDVGGAALSLRKALRLIRAEADPENRKALREFFAEERCLYFLTAVSGAAKSMAGVDPSVSYLADPELMRSLCDELISLRPEWPSVYYVKASQGGMLGLNLAEVLALFEKGLDKNQSSDPILEEINLALGTNRGPAMFALGTWTSMRSGSEADALALFGMIKRLLGPGLESDLVDALIDALSDRQKKSGFKRFVKLFMEIPAELRPDIVQVWVVAYVGSFAVMGQDELGDGSISLREVALKYLRLTDVKGLSGPHVEAMGLIRFGVLSALARSFEVDIDNHSAIRTLREYADGNGTTSLDATNLLMKAHAELREIVAKNTEGSISIFLLAELDASLMEEVKLQMSTIDYRSRDNEELRKTMAPLRRALEEYCNSPNKTGEHDTLVEAIAAATSTSDLNLFKKLLAAMDLAARSQELDEAESRQIAQVKSAYEAKSREFAMRATTRNWSEWQTDPSPSEDDEQITDDPAGMVSGAPNGMFWPFLALGGAAVSILVVVAFATWRRKRKSPAKVA